jgi:type IV secretory pathway VirJ component
MPTDKMIVLDPRRRQSRVAVRLRFGIGSHAIDGEGISETPTIQRRPKLTAGGALRRFPPGRRRLRGSGARGVAVLVRAAVRKLLVAAAVLAGSYAAHAETVDGGRYGPVIVGLPDGEVRGYVVLFSDPDQSGAPSDADIAFLTKVGALVVGVDTKAYFANILRSGKPCDQLVGDAEALSRQLQRLHPGSEYFFPILAGLGQGGTLAYAVLAQAPNNTFSGAVSLDPAPEISGIPPLCPGAPSIATGQGVAYGVRRDLQGFWSAAFDEHASLAAKLYIADLKSRGSTVTTTETFGRTSFETLAGLIAPRLNVATPPGVAALPLVELPAEKPSDLMAVVMSGDGGWRDIDKTLAEDLQRKGISVVGWDCLRYFWREKTPDETAAAMTAVLNHYSALWKARKIVLIGYSFGADVMPFVYNRLPPKLRDKVELVSLLGLESKADWEITISGWLGEPPSDAATPVVPAIALMPSGLVQCFYGEEEPESACPDLPSTDVDLVRTSGGHHFGHDYAMVVARIIAGITLRAPGSPPASPERSP